jgi:hypothetical protein
MYGRGIYMSNKIVFMIILFVVISGCGSSSSPRDVIEYDFREGTSGLEMEFVENAPPKELYESSDFLIGFDVANMGANDIADGVFVLGIEDEYMEVRDWKGYIIRNRNPFEKNAQFDLEGKSQNIPEGGKSRVTVRAKSRLLEPQSETHTSYVLLTSCYPYQTNLVQEVCIDPDVYQIKKANKVCEVADISLSSQGAPVAVTKIQPVMLQSADDETVRPQFTIHLKNVGNGEVFDVNSVHDACSSSSLERKDINYVHVTARLADKSLKCEPQPVHLHNKENSVRCILESGFGMGGSTFISPLVVELSYGYAFTISKEVVIRRLGTSK